MPRRVISLVLTLAAGVAFLVGVLRAVKGAPKTLPPAEVRGHASAPPPPPVSGTTWAPAAEDACRTEWAELSRLPALPGAPALSARRAELMARARAEPVLFLGAPEPSNASRRVRALRARLLSEASPWNALDAIFRTLSDPAERRQALLAEGYLYAEDPAVAALLVRTVSLARLFRDPVLTVVRGAETRQAFRRAGEYVWESGEPARLWLFDRVSVDGEFATPHRHVALGDLAVRLGTAEIAIERLTARGALARLHYEGAVVPAVLGFLDGRLTLKCESIAPGDASVVAIARERSRRSAGVIRALRRTIEEQIAEALPFDEPKTEDGQQDGKLRPEWKRAYLRGAKRYEFNADEYRVFDLAGRPLVPQVCADFISDTWERMAGTWWLGESHPRSRRVGRLNLDELGIENRRRVEQLVEFARARPDWFDLLEVPPEARVPLRNRRRFFEALYQRRRDFRPGDVVAILGPREDERLHYHSFFVLEEDPLTGMPTLLGANAGRPRFRDWESEMASAPRRAIVARIRPRLEWLEQLVGPGDAREPPTRPAGMAGTPHGARLLP